MYNLVERSAYPIRDFEKNILDLAENHDVFAICAPTGSGKSTQVPQILWESGYKKIIIVEETRVATNRLAIRTSDEIGTPLGTVVGFKNGYEKAFSDETEILYTTETTELMNEFHSTFRHFEDCIVILDEAQNGSIPSETIMAWFKKKIDEGQRVKLILMSATMEINKISAFFGNIPVLNVPGRLFEIKEFYRRSNDLIPTIVELVKLQRHVLVFAAGKQEIDQIMDDVKKQNLNVNLLRLHGDLPLAEQQQVFNDPIIPTVVVATNIAQTSLTIPYIDAVVDSGMERRMQKIDGLETLAVGVISKSDYIQRCGRAGRTKPGIYVWCNDVSINDLEEYPLPDIYTGSIHQIVLQLASINVDARDINFLHQPPIEKIETAQKTLRMLGAFDENNQITDCGRIMAKLPVSVRYARMIVEGQKRDVLDDMVTIAALAEFGGIKASKAYSGSFSKEVYYKDFSDETKSDMLAELDCFKLVKAAIKLKQKLEDDFSSTLSLDDCLDVASIDVLKKILKLNSIDSSAQKINAANIDPFYGIIERNYFRVLELRCKLSDILLNIYGDVTSSGNRTEIRKACAAGLVEFLYVRESNGWYNNPDDDYKRKLDKNSATFSSKLLLGLPKNISLAYKGNTGNPVLYLIASAIMVDLPMLEDVAPHLIRTEIRNEYIYETNEYLIRSVTLFGDVEIGAAERRLNDINEKRKALATWFAQVTLDDNYYLNYKLEKHICKIIDKNQGCFDSYQEAYNFYFSKLCEFEKNSLPNIKKAKNISFLSIK